MDSMVSLFSLFIIMSYNPSPKFDNNWLNINSLVLKVHKSTWYL